jgi:hypothetical protein
MKKLFLLFIVSFLFWSCLTDITNDINAHGTVIITNNCGTSLTKIGFQPEESNSFNLDNENMIKDANLAIGSNRSFIISPGKYTLICQNNTMNNYSKLTVNKDETISLSVSF